MPPSVFPARCSPWPETGLHPQRRSGTCWHLVLLLLVSHLGLDHVLLSAEREDPSLWRNLVWDGPGETRWIIDPNHQPYPDYIADPRRSRMQAGIGGFDSSIDDAGNARFILDAGTRFSIVRIVHEDSDMTWSLDIEGGLFHQFDISHSLDSIGWDGRYAAWVVADDIGIDGLTLRAGTRHLSAHLGDEYQIRSGRERIGYTREDLAIGAAWCPHPQVLLYLEPSWAFAVGHERMRRWGIECGGHYYFTQANAERPIRPYVALHVISYQEQDWTPAWSLQAGWEISRSHSQSAMRISFQVYHGHAVLGEFALDDEETYALLGLQIGLY